MRWNGLPPRSAISMRSGIISPQAIPPQPSVWQEKSTLLRINFRGNPDSARDVTILRSGYGSSRYGRSSTCSSIAPLTTVSASSACCMGDATSRRCFETSHQTTETVPGRWHRSSILGSFLRLYCGRRLRHGRGTMPQRAVAEVTEVPADRGPMAAAIRTDPFRVDPFRRCSTWQRVSPDCWHRLSILG